ncbi:MAG: hypothetical protein QM640_06040 [Niabella sp.]
MRKRLFFLNALLFAFSAIIAQTDTLYTINNYNSPGITQIIGIDPSSGSGASVNASYATTDATTLSAAMALANTGYLYYIPQDLTNEGDFTIRSIAAYPTAATTVEPTSSTEVYTGDLNSTTTTTVTYRTLSAAPDGWLYITASDADGTIYLAKFQPGSGGTIVTGSFTMLGTITIDGSVPSNSGLRNGDIAFDGNGNLYALINDDDVGGDAIIYYAAASTISTTSGGVTDLQTRYQVLNSGGTNFSEYVVGLAVASSGNFYIAVQDDNDDSQGGVYLLTRDTNGDFVIGSAISSANARDIADLATGYFPTSTVLPVTLGTISAKIVNNTLTVDWSTLSETNNSRFDIQVSTDGTNFTTIGSVNTLATNGTSDTTLQYTFSKTVNDITAMLGISLLSLSLMLLFLNRRNKFLMMFMMVAGLGITTVSCSKNSGATDTGSSEKLYVRIVQYDIDGNSSQSAVITAYTED